MAHKSSDPANGEQFEIVPAGTHLATCCIVAFIGVHQTPGFKGKPPEDRAQMLYTWELCEEKMADGRPFTISQIYTDSLHENANMRKMLEAWRSRAFTKEELLGFDVTKVLGKSCFINVAHRERAGDTSGRLRARIQNVTALTKGTKVPKMVNTALYYTVEPNDPDCCDIMLLPEWIQKIVRAAKGAKAPPSQGPPPDSSNDNVDIPF